MINKYLLRIKTEFLKYNLKSEVDFFKSISKEKVINLYDENKLNFKDAYNHYVENISRADMAVSLELASLAISLATIRNAKKIVDLGSGFSSYAFRVYALQNKGQVWSIDDDKDWLNKTQAYLEQSNLSTEHIYSLDQFKNSNEAEFDLVLLDLNFVEVRKSYISLAIDRCVSGGLIIFDDVHKPEYMQELLLQTENASIVLYNMKSLTLDQYDRYAIVGIKQ